MPKKTKSCVRSRVCRCHPVFFLLKFGMIEFGAMVMVQQIIADTSREGARRADLDVTEANEVVSNVTDRL